jgi:hypothetical protein
MTPGESIRKVCVECVGSIYEVAACGGDHCLNGGSDKNGICLFYKYRMGTGRPSVKTIRKMCLFCMGGSDEMVKECPGDSEKEGVHCELWPYRLGRNPNIVVTEERRERLREIGKETLYAAKKPQDRLSLAGQG